MKKKTVKRYEVRHLNQLSNNFLIMTQNGIYSFENPPLNYECKKIDGVKYRLVIEEHNEIKGGRGNEYHGQAI